MPITHVPGGSTVFTGDSISFYRLIAFKHAVRIEMLGLKARRGPVVWKQAAREFGIKGNKQKVYDWLCAEVERLKPQQEHVTEEGKREVEGGEVQ